MATLVVVDLDKLHPDVRHYLKIEFDGVLSAEVLAHLSSLAREKEARDAEKLSAILGAPTIGAFRETAPA